MKLIDADALLESAKKYVYPSDMTTTIALGIAETWIKDAPAVDAAPVVYGAWVPLDDDPPEDFECNVCGYVSTASFDCSGITPNAFPYCPMCGARMDGGELNDT